MKIFVPREADRAESRSAIVPETVKRLTHLGAEVEIEAGLGSGIAAPDEAYAEQGAAISNNRKRSLADAGMVLRLNPPPLAEIRHLAPGCIHISLLNPFHNQSLLEKLAAAKSSALAMELIPRTTLAQKMDALSSQANLAGYVAVILAAERLPKILPMMMTPAGTLTPSRVFVIGAGVAGLQAIATAKRLGARVDAFDTRPVVEEQVQSLGARFIKVDLGETGQDQDGYARALTPEQLAKQREAMAAACALADVVITTAQLFGKRAPVIITDDILKRMKPGSLVVDLAIESGGNVEGAEADREIERNGVRILGLTNLPGRVPVHASQMYSANLGNLIEHFWDPEAKTFRLDLDDEILKSCVVTHNGQVVFGVKQK